MKSFGQLCILVGIGFYRAWLASFLWAWHVVPHFHVPALNMWSLMALNFTWTCLMYTRLPSDWAAEPKPGTKEVDARTIDSFAYSFSVSTLAFVFGWLIHVAT